MHRYFEITEKFSPYYTVVISLVSWAAKTFSQHCVLTIWPVNDITYALLFRHFAIFYISNLHSFFIARKCSI